MTISAWDPQAASRTSETTHHVPRTTHPLAELGDPANGVECSNGIACRFRFWRRGRTQSIANVEQYLKQELLALIGGVEICHATLVLRGLGTVVGFTIDRVEIIENLLSRAWTHAQKLLVLGTAFECPNEGATELRQISRGPRRDQVVINDDSSVLP